MAQQPPKSPALGVTVIAYRMVNEDANIVSEVAIDDPTASRFDVLVHREQRDGGIVRVFRGFTQDTIASSRKAALRMAAATAKKLGVPVVEWDWQKHQVIRPESTPTPKPPAQHPQHQGYWVDATRWERDTGADTYSETYTDADRCDTLLEAYDFAEAKRRANTDQTRWECAIYPYFGEEPDEEGDDTHPKLGDRIDDVEAALIAELREARDVAEKIRDGFQNLGHRQAAKIRELEAKIKQLEEGEAEDEDEDDEDEDDGGEFYRKPKSIAEGWKFMQELMEERARLVRRVAELEAQVPGKPKKPTPKPKPAPKRPASFDASQPDPWIDIIDDWFRRNPSMEYFLSSYLLKEVLGVDVPDAEHNRRLGNAMQWFEGWYPTQNVPIAQGSKKRRRGYRYRGVGWTPRRLIREIRKD